MRELKKLKINALNERYLEDKQMNALRGGNKCSCSCYWENNTGSSSTDNKNANYNSGYYSEHGCNQYFEDDIISEYFPACKA